MVAMTVRAGSLHPGATFNGNKHCLHKLWHQLRREKTNRAVARAGMHDAPAAVLQLTVMSVRVLGAGFVIARRSVPMLRRLSLGARVFMGTVLVIPMVTG